MIRNSITIPVLASLLGFSGPASAAGSSSSGKRDPECLWQQMSTTTRSALVSAYESGGADALGSVPISNAAIAAIARSCGMRQASDASLRSAGTAIAGAALQHAAERRLIAMGIPISRLATTWAKAPPDEKRLVVANISDAVSTDRESARQFFQTMVDLARRAGAPLRGGVSPLEDKSVRSYIDWFLGHAQADHFWTGQPRG